MATRSNIAKVYPDGTIKCIYCHWDGYPSHNGSILLEHYQDEEKIDKLISLGALSSLDERVEPIGEHSFDNKEEGTTVAYHRDRGEDLDIMSFNNWKECFQEEYLYIRENGVWYYSRDGKRKYELKENTKN